MFLNEYNDKSNGIKYFSTLALHLFQSFFQNLHDVASSCIWPIKPHNCLWFIFLAMDVNYFYSKGFENLFFYHFLPLVFILVVESLDLKAKILPIVRYQNVDLVDAEVFWWKALDVIYGFYYFIPKILSRIKFYRLNWELLRFWAKLYAFLQGCPCIF